MWYKVDINRLVLLLLPTFLRKQVMAQFIYSMVSPIKTIYNDWLAMRTSNLYILEHNGQVCYLRKVLNDAFDPELRRIEIADGNEFKRDYIYTMAEQKPRFIGKFYIRSRLDYEGTGVDFIVKAPLQIIQVQIYELEALINYYREGVKRYKVEPI